MNTPRTRGLLASLGALAMSAALALAGGAAAHAAPTIPDAPSPDVRGTLSVHKFEQPDSLRASADGMRQDTAGLTPMRGVEFTVTRVTSIDLATNAGWLAAGALSLADATAEVRGTTGTTRATDAQGLAEFDDLPIGLYYVEETKWPSGATPAKPFLVTVPITNERAYTDDSDPDNPVVYAPRTTWLYDVHVYPKNAVTGGEKRVSDSDSVQLGDTVEWTITGDIPKAETIDAYRIVDELDPRLELVLDGAAAPVVDLTGASGVTLAAGDYTWTNTASRLQLDFTEQGRAKLVTAWQADPTAQVRVVLSTTVLSLLAPGEGDEDGVIKNQATIFPNQRAIDWKPGEPGEPPTTTEPETRWGAIVLKKVARGSETPLAGAAFQVFLSEADALAKQHPVTITRDAAGAEIPGGQSTFVSDASGAVVIPGLRYSTWANNAVVAEGDAGYQAYWIVETEAPVGADGTKYELLAKPVKVEVSGASTTIVTDNGVIVNVPKNSGFELPLTGGVGTWLLTAGGVLLIGGGLLLVLRRTRA